MKLRVYSTSGPAWQPVKNGKQYDKWVGTVQFSAVERVFLGHRFTATVVGGTKEDVAQQLDKYHWGEIMEVSPDRLNPDPIIGVKNASTAR